MQCKRCGAINFGGYCPICGYNSIKLGLEGFGEIFPINDWATEKLNWYKNCNLNNLLNYNEKKINISLTLNRNNLNIKESNNIIINNIQNNANDPMDLNRYSSFSQLSNKKWIDKINEDSGFVSRVSIDKNNENDMEQEKKPKKIKNKNKNIDKTILH
ncbi:MAG: hypothetical protein ACTSPY_14595 [Candidatus Helarchaeota archaeon]